MLFVLVWIETHLHESVYNVLYKIFIKTDRTIADTNSSQNWTVKIIWRNNQSHMNIRISGLLTTLRARWQMIEKRYEAISSMVRLWIVPAMILILSIVYNSFSVAIGWDGILKLTKFTDNKTFYLYDMPSSAVKPVWRQGEGRRCAYILIWCVTNGVSSI